MEAKRWRSARALCGAILLAIGLTSGSKADDEAAEKKPATGHRHADAASVDADAPHRHVRRFEFGTGPKSYWLFEPDEPRTEKAPVVVFFHGWFAVNPGFYGAWIDHLVRNGKVVIFPRYQKDVGTLPGDFLPNSLEAIRDALAVLHDGVDHVRPDTSRFALIGHSAGGNLAAQIAAVSADPAADLPKPTSVIVVMPGEVLPMREPRLSRIPAETLLVVMVGEDDLIVGDFRGRQIFAEASSVPLSRKRFILFRSDRHGSPPLIAEHTAPTGVHHRLDNGEGVFRFLQLSLGDVNALDFAGFWRIGDLTLDAGFNGKTMDELTRDHEKFRHLGYWSDGRRVIPPVVSSDLSAVPRVILSNGIKLIPWSIPARPPVALDGVKSRD